MRLLQTNALNLIVSFKMWMQQELYSFIVIFFNHFKHFD